MQKREKVEKIFKKEIQHFVTSEVYAGVHRRDVWNWSSGDIKLILN